MTSLRAIRQHAQSSLPGSGILVLLILKRYIYLIYNFELSYLKFLPL